NEASQVPPCGVYKIGRHRRAEIEYQTSLLHMVIRPHQRKPAVQPKTLVLLITVGNPRQGLRGMCADTADRKPVLKHRNQSSRFVIVAYADQAASSQSKRLTQDCLDQLFICSNH